MNPGPGRGEQLLADVGEPGPLAALLVTRALMRIREVGPEHANTKPNEVSGPMLLTDLVKDISRSRDDVRVYDESYFYPIGWWETNRLGEATGATLGGHGCGRR